MAESARGGAQARGELMASEPFDEEKENEDTEPAPRSNKLAKKAATDIAGVRSITSFFGVV